MMDVDSAAVLEAAMERWQRELSERLATNKGTRVDLLRPEDRKLHFSMCNCVEVDQETRTVGFMSLAGNAILNIPIVASAVAELPLTRTVPYFQLEIMDLGTSGGTLVIGLVNKSFPIGQEPGSLHHTVGYSISNGSVCVGGVQQSCDKETAEVFVAGDKLGCGLDFSLEPPTVYFTKNDSKIFEGLSIQPGEERSHDSSVEWYPALSFKSLREQVHLVDEPPWRTASVKTPQCESLKVNKENGQIVFRSMKKRGETSTLIAGQPFSAHFAFFEIEIIALGEEDEVAVGAVPENYSRRHLPGLRAKSAAYHGNTGGILGGSKLRRTAGRKVAVGDKMGCGVEGRTNGQRYLYFTHNSESFEEVQLNERTCPSQLFPALGLRSASGTAVSVCIQDATNWSSEGGDETAAQLTQVDMETVVEQQGEVKLNKETARASYCSSIGIPRDAVLVSSSPLSATLSYFEIEIAYGSLITMGLVMKTGSDTITAHPGFTGSSVGYNAELGRVYVNGKVSDCLAVTSRSCYGDRIGCGIRLNNSGERMVYFNKNSKPLCEVEWNAVIPVKKMEVYSAEGGKLFETPVYPAVAMRSAGQMLAVRLLDRQLWECLPAVDSSDISLSDPNSNTVAKLLERDHELIECPICRDVFTDPRTYPCGNHSFCAACLVAYINQQPLIARTTVPCPICRQVCTLPPEGTSKLPVNQELVQLINIYKTVASPKPVAQIKN